MKIFNKIKTIVILFILKLGFRIKLKQVVLDQALFFYIQNKFEYYSRFKLPYKAEPLMIEWVNDFIKKDSVVYDIGSNVGNYSILIAKKLEKLNGNGVCYAFEPFFKNFKRLCENISINNLDSKRIIPINHAISNKKKISFYLPNSNIEGSSGKISNTKGQIIIETTLKDFLTHENIYYPSDLKIDIDFNTRNIFYDSSFLQNKTLRSIYIEIQDTDYEFIRDQLIKYNFKEYKKHKYPKSDTNYIFLR